uniref:Ig-like domain-containing protein n=1 Tax=Athene cunicularia TaxID=194338 RepID=A0A663M5M8_ATHCN
DLEYIQEIQQKSKATLVCLASGFYPDHMKLFWKVNGAERTEGVGTDEFSTQNEGTYSLTSRLRISAQEWFNPLNRFECVATFFKNGTLESINKFIYGDAVMLVSKIYVGVESSSEAPISKAQLFRHGCRIIHVWTRVHVPVEHTCMYVNIQIMSTVSKSSIKLAARTQHFIIKIPLRVAELPVS